MEPRTRRTGARSSAFYPPHYKATNRCLACYCRFALPLFELLGGCMARPESEGALPNYQADAVIVAAAGMATRRWIRRCRQATTDNSRLARIGHLTHGAGVQAARTGESSFVNNAAP